eukprot:g4780.t1
MPITFTAKKDRVSKITCFKGKPEKEYPVFIGQSVFDVIPHELRRLCPKVKQFVLITDDLVYKHHGERMMEAFEKGNMHEAAFLAKPLVMVIPNGERSKCRKQKAAIEEWMLKNGCKRDCGLLAFGGGVIGDLVGFVAATYMRGVPFVQIPTTVLSMVDSSVGGKTAIDTPTGKNLIGAFHQPKAVFAGLDVLATLPQRQLVNGLCESIKMAACCDAAFFEYTEASVDAALARDATTLGRIIYRSVEIKRDVVVQDEREKGVRAVLNWGHTIGHAIEHSMQPDMLHGECVAVGIVKEIEIARALGLCSSATVGRVVRILKAYQLPTRVPEKVGVDDALNFMQYDKKNSSGKIKCILLEQIGRVVEKPTYAHVVDPKLIRRVVSPKIRVVPGVASGNVRVPGSKSLSNRMLLMAGLAKGTTRLGGLLHSDDTQVMQAALEQLGASFVWEKNATVLAVTGTGGAFKTPRKELYLSNAGTASRFLTSVATLVKGSGSSGGGGGVVVTGNARAQERPIGPLVDALRAHGCDMTCVKKEGFLPLRIGGTGLRGGRFDISGKISSQYISSVLLSAPFADQPLELHIAEEKPTSLPYIRMTIKAMENFGVRVRVVKDNHYSVPNCGYAAPSGVIFVEPDASSATYALAMAAVGAGTVTVQGVGKSSLQGDAQFCNALERMGCSVAQTETSTTVTGTCELKGIDIDMMTMTDAFMTLAAVAAVAKGVTNITGIANQRVKECDRIAAMVRELAKSGVEAWELDDGIAIRGLGLGATSRKTVDAHVHCYNDHRIAMSFAVLGTRIHGIVIADKECTDKTFPEFWDHAHNGLHLDLETPNQELHALQFRGDDKPSPANVVLLIGMRCSGKSSLARSAAAYVDSCATKVSTLGLDRKWDWTCVDVDEELQKDAQMSVKEFVAKKGWGAFRKLECDTLRRVLRSAEADRKRRTLVACGGGVVETEETRELLRLYRGQTIYVRRHPDDVERELESGGEPKQKKQKTKGGTALRPTYAHGEAVRDVQARRHPHYYALSSFDFEISRGESNWKRVNTRFCEILRVVGRRRLGGDAARRSAMASIPPPETVHTTSVEITSGVDGIRSVPSYLKASMDKLRRKLRGDTEDNEGEGNNDMHSCVENVCGDIRSSLQALRDGGPNSDVCKKNGDAVVVADWIPLFEGDELCSDAFDDAYRRMNEASLRAGADVVCVDFSSISTKTQESLVSCARALGATLVGSYDLGGVGSTEDVARVVKSLSSQWEEEKRCGRTPDVLCLHARDLEDGSFVTPSGGFARLLECAASELGCALDVPTATYGRSSSVLRRREQSGRGEREDAEKRYFIFGHPVEKSPSPAMHNCGFQALGYEKRAYERMDTNDIWAVVEVMRNMRTFGGASVTIPFKETIIPHLDTISPVAKRIGAVNTVVVKPSADGRKSSLHGDNSDWIGIVRCLENSGVASRLGRSSSSSHGPPPSVQAVVVGAGGTARAALFALHYLNIPTAVYNRTFARARGLAAEFCGARAIHSLHELKETPPALIVSTVPPGANVPLPDTFLRAKPTVFDVVYIPLWTPLLRRAESAGCQTIHGRDMLLAQGLQQMEWWTGRRAPAREMAKAMVEFTKGFATSEEGNGK